MLPLLLRVMLHVIARLHVRGKRLEFFGQMIERRVLHAGEVGHHSGNHAPKIDGPLLIGIADKIDVRTDTQRLTRPACFLETSQRHVHRPAYALGRAAHGKAHPITHVDRHRNGLRPGAGHINEHRIDFEAVEPSQPRRRAVTIDRLATGIGLQALHEAAQLRRGAIADADVRSRRIATTDAADDPALRLRLQRCERTSRDGRIPRHRVGDSRAEFQTSGGLRRKRQL